MLRPYDSDHPHALKGSCPHDGDGWQLVLTTRTAVPIRAVGARTYGIDRSRTITHAEPHEATDGMSTVWSWACGDHTVLLPLPTVEVVGCTFEAGANGTCRVRSLHLNPPHDYYTNPRHGQACPCCGHQGTHTVRRDRAGELPACLQP